MWHLENGSLGVVARQSCGVCISIRWCWTGVDFSHDERVVFAGHLFYPGGGGLRRCVIALFEEVLTLWSGDNKSTLMTLAFCTCDCVFVCHLLPIQLPVSTPRPPSYSPRCRVLICAHSLFLSPAVALDLLVLQFASLWNKRWPLQPHPLSRFFFMAFTFYLAFGRSHREKVKHLSFHASKSSLPSPSTKNIRKPPAHGALTRDLRETKWTRFLVSMPYQFAPAKCTPEGLHAWQTPLAHC